MRRMALVVVLLISFVMIAGCKKKGNPVWRPAGSPGYVEMEGKKFLVLPADMRYLPGDKLKLSAALFGGFIAKFGASGISLQPLQPALEKIGLGDLSWKLARGMVHAAFFHNSVVWDACSGEDYSVIPDMLKKLIDKVAELLNKPELKFDYIVVLHIDTFSSRIPKMVNMRVIGGIYDPMKSEIAVAIRFEKKTAEDALLAEMATIGPKAIKMMAGENPNAKGGEAAADKPAEGGDAVATEKPAEEKPAEEKPAEEKPAEGGDAAAPAEGGEAATEKPAE